MIKVISNELMNFNTLEEFYKWLMKANNIDDLKIEGSKEAEWLYSFLKFYKGVKSICESQIDIINNSFKNDSDNELVKEAVCELIRMNSEGKFLRASLIALGYKSFSKENDTKYLPLTAAYETFQTSILIHDDIIDNADLRRGKVTIPKSYEKRFNEYEYKDKEFSSKSRHISDSLGICIGDLGFYLASKIMLDNYFEDKNFHNILNLYNKIVINTIKGEIIDVALPFKEQYLKNITSESAVMEIYHLKTAWYSIIGPFSLGMALAGAEQDKIDKLEEILNNLGIAFQIKDDILGIFGCEDEIGKSASSDVSEFKQTILYAYLVENNVEMLKEMNEFYGKESLTKEDINRVKAIFTESGALDYATEKMEKLFEQSKGMLDSIDFIQDDYKSILYGFMKYLDLRTK